MEWLKYHHLQHFWTVVREGGIAALAPPPRMHTLTYHVVLAPASSWRSEIVPRRLAKRRYPCRGSAGATRPCSQYSWPELMLRTFALDVLRCGKGGCRRRSIVVIMQAQVIARILYHLSLESAAPTPATTPPLRSPETHPARAGASLGRAYRDSRGSFLLLSS